MNVNPLAAPGPASTARIATGAESQQVPASASDRENVRQRPVTPAPAPSNGQAGLSIERNGQAQSADRQKAEQLKAFIGNDDVRLSTYHDEDSGRNILQVRDQVTGDVVSQYPSEELIRLYAALRQPFVDQSA